MSQRRTVRRGGVAVMAASVGLVVGGVVGVGMTGGASAVPTTDGVVHIPMESHDARDHEMGRHEVGTAGADQARARVRAVLESLVADGTLTPEQVDRVVERLEAARAEHRAAHETHRAERREQRGQMRAEMHRRFAAN